MTGARGACPSCGAPVEFGGAHSVAAVCSHCRSAVVRKGVAVESIGKVPDLVSTSTRLALGDAGSLDGAPFRLVGRLQLEQGAAAWDEWYAQFADGQDGWLAEAQGLLLVTRRIAVPGRLPAFESLQPGKHIQLKKIGDAAVAELGRARFVSAAGELPFAPAVGGEYRFADCSGKQSAFATIDYGGAGDEPELFAGKRIDYSAAGLAEVLRARRTTLEAGPEGTALSCPSCGAPLSLKRPESLTVACPSCRSLLDVQRGALAVLGKLKERADPPIPLGARGAIRGLRVEVLAYLRRYIEVDGVQYDWNEWQLFSDQGYRYLSEYNGHFVYLEPLEAGEVSGNYQRDYPVSAGGTVYRHFQTAIAHYRDIQGELSWQARINDSVKMRDYVAPPLALSVEEEKGEVNFSRGESIPAAELWKALSLPGAPPAQTGVGYCQPNPYARGKHLSLLCALIGFGALVVGAIFLDATLPHESVLRMDVALKDENVAVSEPFTLVSASQAVEVRASAPIEASWAGLELALIDEESGDAHVADLEISHFSGYEDGESWSEGSRSAGAVLGSVPRGTYVLRAEVTLDPASARNVPNAATIEVVRGVFTWAPLVLAALALWIPALFLTLAANGFERRRWAESDESDDEDD